MKKIDITYSLFYCAFAMVVCVSVLFDKIILVYTKPIIPLLLIWLYVKKRNTINPLFPIAMIVILVTDVLNYLDFIKYFDYIAILISSFYVLCVFLLKNYIAKDDVKLHQLTSIPIIVGSILIFYIIYAITELTLPKLKGEIWQIILMVSTVLVFIGVSFVIFVADRYEKVIYLFIAACCTLFVDSLLGINELYYYNRVFTVLITITETTGLYFFTKFFIQTKECREVQKKTNYF